MSGSIPMATSRSDRHHRADRATRRLRARPEQFGIPPERIHATRATPMSRDGLGTAARPDPLGGSASSAPARSRRQMKEPRRKR